MPTELQVVIRHIRRSAGRVESAARSDQELLTRYAHERDELAFTELVKRHALLVAGVAGRVLRNEHDIEDVVQATFLVIARRAGAVRWSHSVSNWLHSVAYHLALRQRRNRIRQEKLTQSCLMRIRETTSTTSDSQSWEMQELLDRELAALPDACRTALILCYLEGRTRDQAARHTGWSLRTLDRRLDEGRRLLRARLARRGMNLSVVMLVAALSEPVKANISRLTNATLEFVSQSASINPAAASSALKLANSLLTGVVGTSTKIAAGIILTIVLVGVGTGLLSLNTSRASQQSAKASLQDGSNIQEKRVAALAKRDLFGDPLPDGAVARLGSDRFRLWGAHSVAYSADGKLLIAGGQRGIAVFDSTTGRALRKFGHDLGLTCWSTGVSPDGKLAAVGGLEAMVDLPKRGVICETATGNCLSGFQAPVEHDCRIAVFSPDDRVLAAAASRWQVDLYESRTGKLLRTLEWERETGQIGYSSAYSFMDVAFTPNGEQLFASTHSTGIIRVFEVQGGKELCQFRAFRNGISSMGLSADGGRLAVLESAPRPKQDWYHWDWPGNRVRIFDARTKRQLVEFQCAGFQQSMAISHDGGTLFAGNDENGIGIWDTTRGIRIGSVPYPYLAAPERRFALAPDGKSLAQTTSSGIRVTELRTGAEPESRAEHKEAICSVALHPLDAIVATGGCDGRLLLWDRATGRMLRELLAGKGLVASVTYSPNGRFLYAIAEIQVETRHSSVRCWNSTNGKEIWRLDDHPVQPGKLTISPDGKTLGVLGQSDGLLIEAATGKPIRTLDGEGERSFQQWMSGSRKSLAFSANGQDLVAWGESKGIHHWNVATGEHRAQPSATLQTVNPGVVAFSPDLESLVVGGCVDQLLIVDAVSGEKIREIKAGPTSDFVHSTNALEFSPDGRTLIWAGPVDGIIRFVDMSTGLVVQQLAGSSSTCNGLVYSNDCKILISNCGDGTALVWELARLRAKSEPLRLRRP